MSKEITPQEAQETLEFIIDTFNKLAQKPQDIGLMFKFGEAHEKINQALDRLELLEKENQELKEKAIKYDELCMHNVMESQSFGDDLIQGILALNKRVIERNKKQVKVIAWLKNTFEITLDSKVRISDGTDCIQAFPIDLKTNEVIYDLLKEVLE